MNEEKIAMLKERAKQLRKTAVTMIYDAEDYKVGADRLPGRLALRSGYGRGLVFLRDAHRPQKPRLGGPGPLRAL